MKSYFLNIDLRKGLITIPLLYYITFLIFPLLKLLLFVSTQGNFFSNFINITSDALFWKIFYNNISISFQVAFFALLIGFPIAYLILHCNPHLSRVVIGLVVASMWLSILIRSYAWTLLLQKNGFLNNYLLEIGLLKTPISIIYTRLSVIIGMVHILIPYAVFIIWGSVKNSVKIKRQIASSLGASDSFYFFKILLPLLMPACIAAFLIIFLLSIGFYITPALLGGGNGDSMMISTLIEQQMNMIGDWQKGAVLSLNLVVLSFLIIFIIIIQPNVRNVFINLFNLEK